MAVLLIFPLTLQTVINMRMLSIEKRGDRTHCQCTLHISLNGL